MSARKSEQCIAGAKRISSTLHGLVNYARPGPLVLSKISLQRLVADTLAFLEHQPMVRGKELENTVPRDLPYIRADANQLSPVLITCCGMPPRQRLRADASPSRPAN